MAEVPAMDAERTAAPLWIMGPFNSPQAERGKKGRLLRWPRRGREIRRLAARDGITFFGMQEVGLRHVRTFIQDKRYKFVRARPNDVLGPNFQVGNGGLLDMDQLEVLHRRLLPVLTRYGWRFIPILLCADRRTGDRVILIAAHADRKRPTAAPGRRVLRAVAREGARLHRKLRVPVAAFLDSNNSPLADEIFQGKGWRRTVGGGSIDKGYALGMWSSNERSLGGYHGVVTDHPNPRVADHRPIVRNFTLNRLPQLSKGALRALKRLRRRR